MQLLPLVLACLAPATLCTGPGESPVRALAASHATHDFPSGSVWICRDNSLGSSGGYPLQRLRHATCALQGVVQAQGGQQAVRHCCHSRLFCRACSQGGAAGEVKGFHGLRRRGCRGHAQSPVLRSAAKWSVCAAWLQSERAHEYRGASTGLGLRASIWDEVILNRLTTGQQQSFLCVPASFRGRGCNVGTCLEGAQDRVGHLHVHTT